MEPTNFGLHPSNNGGDPSKGNDPSNNLFFSNILNTLPSYQDKSLHNDNNLNGNSLFSNLLEHQFHHKLDQRTNGVINSFGNFNIDSSNPIDIFCNNGNSNGKNTHKVSPTSTSPHTNSSTGSTQSSYCIICDNNAVNRCLECASTFCAECIVDHATNAYTKGHTVIGLGKITPIGSASSASTLMVHHVPQQATNYPSNDKIPQCVIHNESLSFLCETCRTLICQGCALKEHNDHEQIAIADIDLEKIRRKLLTLYETSKLGIKYIKTSIDRAVNYTQNVEKDTSEIASRVKKLFRTIIMAAEERERTILEELEKMRLGKSSSLNDQMTGLRSALAGMAELSEDLSKAIDKFDTLPQIEIASILVNSDNNIMKYKSMYNNLLPTEEVVSFVQKHPHFEILEEIRKQGELVVGSKNATNNFVRHSNPVNVSPALTNTSMNSLSESRSSDSPNGSNQLWMNPGDMLTTTAGGNNASSLVTSTKTYASIVKPTTITTSAPFGQAIPGINRHIRIRPAAAPSLTFCFDGQDDGCVSRPWGVCVNKNNEIIIADRRNNRIQVFFADGTYKFKFGSKGTGNGQFDLPAGVATDSNNRIVVVDKDNHRIQVFSATGVFILKFGSYGKELSQFAYPWAVATNTKNQILVTDSRNHRIQLFSPDGHFISRFSFDGVNHSRYLKGITTPRGVCFNSQGNVIISDFENHRLILIDSTMTKILATKGHEGSALHEFCRPSGLCCDDDGRIIVADSKNQRVLIFSPMLEFLYTIEIRPSSHNVLTANMDEKDRPSDVALLNDGRLVVLVETSPDSREVLSPHKTFVQIY